MNAGRQLWALVRLRWTLVRSPLVRLGLLGAMAVAPVLGALVLLNRDAVEQPSLVAAVHAAPAAFLGFGVLAVLAPLTASGSELVPSDQLVAYPVRPGTLFLSSLVLAPVNLVWVVQLLVLTAETGFLTLGQPYLAQGAVTTTLFVLACTGVGQALSWWLSGLRRVRRGRVLLRVAVVALAVAGVAVVRTGHAGAVLDHSFGPPVADAVAAGGRGDLGAWAPVTVVLLAVVLGALWLGVRACRWSLRRPNDLGGDRTARPVRRRAPAATAYQALLATDRASVWRAPALRRGALVLGIMPGLAAAGVGLPWRSLVFLPGLVAAGGGLLFGFNAFCLDGSGAVWLASLPHPPGLIARAKARVTAESVLLSAGLAAAVGSVRALGTPTATQLTALLATVVGCSWLVVAICLAHAVRRPYRADLTGPRDAVAPPGAMVLTSVKLVFPTAVLGAVLEASATAPQWWLPLVIALPVTALSSWSISTDLRRYDDPVRRARIVSVVSAG